MENKKSYDGEQPDIYGKMYQDRLEKFNSMANDGTDDTEDTLRFYSEEELEAIDRAKRDAAQQAYEDAYRREYEKSSRMYREQLENGQSVRSGNNAGGNRTSQRGTSAKVTKNTNGKRRKSSSQRYGSTARSKHEGEQMEFGSQNSYKNSKKGKKEMSGGSAVAKFFKGLLIIILVILILSQLLIFRYINMVNSVDTGTRLVTDASMSDSKVKNILLIGSDTRDEDERGRTDSMILLSINSSTHKTTMTSFMRDCYVEIPDYGWAKLNAAYVYGGAELLMDTIEQNFDVQVDRYVYVNFYSFIDIVDAVGGIEMEITDEEAEYMIDPMAEQNDQLGNEEGTDYLTGGGKLTLNGNQTLAYARIRYIDSDFERTQRQRNVINQILAKAKTLTPLKLDNFLKVCAADVTTNMTKSEMYFMFYRLLFSLNYESDELRIPADDSYSYGTHDGQSTLDLDFDACKRDIKETIYN